MKIAMSGEAFTKWCAEMQRAGLVKTDKEAGELLGRSQDRMVAYKRDGADVSIALACRALLHRLEPYS